MGLLGYFKDPNTRPKALAASVLLGGALAYGAYHFWTHRSQIVSGVKKVEDKLEKAASKIGDKIKEGALEVEHKIEEALYKLSHKLPSAKDRVKEFKNIYLERFVEAKKKAFADADKDALSFDSLLLIQQLAIEMAEKDFRKITKLNRESRRKFMENEKAKYEAILIEGEKDFEKIFSQNLLEILKECEVSKEKYDNSMGANLTYDDNVYLEGSGLQQAMVLRLPAINEPTPPSQEYTIEIHKFMLDEYHKIAYRPMRKEYYTEVKDKLVFDRVHMQYGIEEEDVLKLRRNFDSLELKDLISQYNSAIVEDESQHGNFPVASK